MSTTHQADKPPEWGKWGNEGEKQPQLKDYVELLIKYNNIRKFLDTIQHTVGKLTPRAFQRLFRLNKCALDRKLSGL